MTVSQGERSVVPFRKRRPRFTAQDIESHLRHELMYWLPHGGEAGDTDEERRRMAAHAAKIITDKLAGPER
jgi:hypothetical protein